MTHQNQVISSEKLAKLTDSMTLAKETEEKAKSLCELAENFAKKYEDYLIKTKSVK
jgi:hypothetical protein